MSQCWILVTDGRVHCRWIAGWGGFSKSLKGHSFQHSLLPIFQDCYNKAELGGTGGSDIEE